MTTSKYLQAIIERLEPIVEIIDKALADNNIKAVHDAQGELKFLLIEIVDLEQRENFRESGY